MRMPAKPNDGTTLDIPPFVLGANLQFWRVRALAGLSSRPLALEG